MKSSPPDGEIKLDPASSEVTVCPTFYWEEQGVEFVIFKVAENRYRSQFYYSLTGQYGVGAILTTWPNAQRPR